MDYYCLVCSILLLLSQIHHIAAQNAKPPEIIENPVDTLVRKNEPATLNCLATGNPQPVIHWYVNGQKVKTNAHRMQWPSGALFFLQVQSGSGKNKESSEGVYYCVASNEYGKVKSRNATLSVASKPPEIIENPVDTLVRKNEPATLNCLATGNPQPVIHWYVNGQKVKTNAHRMQWPSGALFFLQVQSGSGKNKESSEGVYYCVASNEYGKVKSRNATLSVAYIHKEFRIAPKSVQANFGDTVHFQCSIRALPEATIKWLKDGQPFIDSNGLILNQQPSIFHSSSPHSPHDAMIASDNNNNALYSSQSDAERIKMLTGGTLRLLNVQPKDNARYSCVAENFVDTRESPPAMLTVFVKPFFTQKPKNVIVMVSEPIELACSAEADPPPSISWSRKDTSKESRFIVDKDNTLHIENAQLSDQGIYVCEASNQADSVIAHVQVTVHSSPQLINKPEDVKAQQGSSVRLQCSAAGSPEPTLIYLRQLDFEAIQMLNVAPSSLPDILNQLTNTHQKSELERQTVLFAGHDYSRMHVDNEGNLVLRSAKKDDEGEFINFLFICSFSKLIVSNLQL